MQARPLADVRANLSRIVEEAVTTHERVEITRNGVRDAVLMGADDYDGLMETVDILSDASLVEDIRAALADLQAGDVLSTQDILEGLPQSRRGER